MTRRARIRGGWLIAAAFAAGLARPAQAAFTVAEGDRGKLEVEARVMFWADASGRQGVPDQQERSHDFFLRRTRILLQCKTGKSLSFSLQLGQDNIGSEVLTEDGSFRIKDAYVSYRAAAALQLTAGQFKVPFLRANLESGFNQLLVDRGTLPTLRPAREGSRDLGAMAWGNLRRLQYRLAVFDGSDQEARNPASSLRFTGRLACNWLGDETGLGYTGSYQGAKRVLQVAGQLDAHALPRDYRTYAIEGFLDQPFAKDWALTLEGAWFDRHDDYQQADLATRRVEGFYAQGGILLPGDLGPGRLQLAARHEDWDTKRGSSKTTSQRTTGGATCFFKGHDRKLQVDYTRKRETPEIDNDEFRLSVVAVF